MNEQQYTPTLFPYLILMIPFIVLNVKIAKRKGKNSILFGFLSVIPLVNFWCSIYLASLTDTKIKEKLGIE
ncbi:MAG: hypothetical protein GY931_04245 [Maribacter sp.]|nr:hypothetical protein [Maribacter sp.]